LPSGEIVDQEKPSFKETIELTDMPTEKAQIDIGIPPEEIRTTFKETVEIIADQEEIPEDITSTEKYSETIEITKERETIFLKVTSCSCCGARISISTEGCFGANSTVSSNLSSVSEGISISISTVSGFFSAEITVSLKVISKSSVEISDETFVESIGIDQPSAVEIQLAGPTDEIFKDSVEITTTVDKTIETVFNNAWPFWQNFNTFGIFHVFGYFW
jgi:hypothetical protein